MNDPYNGVTLLDAVLINRHILGIVPFQNPYQWIAADVNNSGTITTFDIVQIQALILGKIPNFLASSSFPDGISWRYVPKFFTENQPFKTDFDANPFTAEVQDPFQGFTRKYKSQTLDLVVPNTDSWMDFASLFSNSGLANTELAWSFTGIKLGDVNCSAYIEDDPFQGDDNEFLLDSASLTSASFSGTKRIQIVAAAPKEVVAWQFGVRYTSDSLTVSNLAAGTDASTFDEDNFHVAPADSVQATGDFRAIWFAEDDEPVDIDGKVLFEFEATATQGLVQITQAFQLDKEVLPFFFYDKDGELVPNVSLTLHIADVPQGFQVPVPGNTARPSKPLRVKTFPVPFTSEVIFAFDLPKDNAVRLDIFDGTGAMVSSSTVHLPAGPHELHISDLAQRPAGFYWYALQAGELTARGKLSKR